MSDNFLFKLYFKVPHRFKNRILKRIEKTEGGQMYSPTLRAIFKKQYGIEVGYGSYGGCFNLKNNIPRDVSFGNYCSIAQTIRIFRANHPKNTFTSHPLLYNPVAGYVKKDMLDRPALRIGHDVWIGEGAIILPHVKSIGNGAMIGAGSIVTKDVPPYTVVAGNPAKILGERFSKETIEELEATAWWTMSKEKLIDNIDRLNKITAKQKV